MGFRSSPVAGVALCLGVLASGTTVSAGLGVRDEMPRELPAPARAPRAQARLDRLPLRFVENRGQADAHLRYVVHGRGRVLGFADDGVRFAIEGDGARSVVDVGFEGANAVVPQARDRAATSFNWFRGRPANWRTGVAAFGRIVYRGLWDGVDLVWTGELGLAKYEFHVAAGADPAAIRLLWRGAASIAVDGCGALRVETRAGAFEDDAPVAWQEKDGERVPVPVSFALGERSADGARLQGFRLGAYDASRALVIDPAVVVYAGFLAGGSGEESGNAIAVDGSGAAYVVGRTRSDADVFPATGTLDTSFNGGELDVFVAKVDPSGTDLVYAGFIGGDDDEDANAVAVDGSGNAYVAGYTYSTETSFPLAGGALSATHGAGADAFVCKVSSQGTALTWSGFLGGDGRDNARAISLDANANAYVAGSTDSTESTFPVLNTSMTLSANHGGTDAFAAEVLANGTLQYTAFVGGASGEEAYGIAVDDLGAAYLTGRTSSDQTTFPVAVGPDLTFNGHSSGDAFVAKLAPDGHSIAYCGYIGGSGPEVGYAIAVDEDREPWIVGYTSSTEATFPVGVGPDLTFNGNQDAFLAHVAAGGAALLACGYLGGSDSDQALGVAIEPPVGATGAKNVAPGMRPPVWVTGSTRSDQTTFPVVVGPSLTSGGGYDAFLARIDANNLSLLSCGFLGGTGSDGATAVAVDASGNAYVTGRAGSSDGTFPAVVGPDTSFNGTDGNSFVVKFGAPAAALEVDSFLLPNVVNVKLDAKDPTKSILVAGGIFDLGSGIVDLTRTATVQVGGLSFEATPVLKGRRLRIKAAGLTLAITQPVPGSSRAKFKLKAQGDLAASVAVDSPVTLRFSSADVDARGTVDLTSGRYKLGRVKGTLIAPALAPNRVRAALKGAGNDTLFVVAAVAGSAPPSPPDVTITFADAAPLTVAGASFVRKGDVFKFKGAAPGLTQLTLDFVRGTLKASGKGLTLGVFAEGTNVVHTTVEVGAQTLGASVRMVRKGTKLAY